MSDGVGRLQLGVEKGVDEARLAYFLAPTDDYVEVRGPPVLFKDAREFIMQFFFVSRVEETLVYTILLRFDNVLAKHDPLRQVLFLDHWGNPWLLVRSILVINILDIVDIVAVIPVLLLILRVPVGTLDQSF